MSKEITVIVLGVWVVLLTQLGIPGSWRTTLLVLTGVGLVAIGFFLRAEALSRGGKRDSRHPFTENGASHAQEISHEQKTRVPTL